MDKLIVLFCAVLLSACGSQALVTDSAPEKVAEVVKPPVDNGDYFVSFKSNDLMFYGELKEKASSRDRPELIGTGGDALFAMIAAASHVSKAKNERQLAAEQDRKEADEILLAYKSYIDFLSMDKILDDDFYLSSSQAGAGAAFKLKRFDKDYLSENVWQVDVAPSFVMSQLQNSIMLVTRINIFESAKRDYLNLEASSEELPYSKTVIVRLQPIDDKSLWLEQVDTFKTSLQELLVTSLDIAIKDFSGALPPKGKTSTIRYRKNGKKKVERGYLMSSGKCKYVLFESLKGELKFFPSVHDADIACNQSHLPVVALQ